MVANLALLQCTVNINVDKLVFNVDSLHCEHPLYCSGAVRRHTSYLRHPPSEAESRCAALATNQRWL